MIPGSPLCTEIFDPSKILLEGVKRCKVEELMVVDGKLLSLDLAANGIISYLF